MRMNQAGCVLVVLVLQSLKMTSSAAVAGRHPKPPNLYEWLERNSYICDPTLTSRQALRFLTPTEAAASTTSCRCGDVTTSQAACARKASNETRCVLLPALCMHEYQVIFEKLTAPTTPDATIGVKVTKAATPTASTPTPKTTTTSPTAARQTRNGPKVLRRLSDLPTDSVRLTTVLTTKRSTPTLVRRPKLVINRPRRFKKLASLYRKNVQTRSQRRRSLRAATRRRLVLFAKKKAMLAKKKAFLTKRRYFKRNL